MFFYRRCSTAVSDTYPLAYPFSPFSLSQSLRGAKSRSLRLSRRLPAHAARASQSFHVISVRIQRFRVLQIALAVFQCGERSRSGRSNRAEEPRGGATASRHLQYSDRFFRRAGRPGGRAENAVFDVSHRTAGAAGLASAVRRVRERERSADRAGCGGVCADEEREGSGLPVDSAV